MTFSEVLIEIFDIKDNIYNSLDLYILNKLKHNGYLYLIKTWTKIEDLYINNSNCDQLVKTDLIDYFNTYLKIYIVENDFNKGSHLFLEKICNSNNSNVYRISHIFLHTCITMLDDIEIGDFVYKLYQILRLSKFNLNHLLQFYTIITNKSILAQYIVNSDEWICNNTYKNEYMSHLGMLFCKQTLITTTFDDNITNISSLINTMCNSSIKVDVYKWFIHGIQVNKPKLQLMNSDEYLYSDVFLIKIFCVLQNLINEQKQSENYYLKININDYNLENINNLTNFESTLFFINYWYFILSIKYIITDYNIYIKEIVYIDSKINEITKSEWWQSKHKLRIQYFSKLKKKKYGYQKKKNKYLNLLKSDVIVNNYINTCTLICTCALQNNNIYNSEDIMNTIIDSILTLFKYNNKLVIDNSIELIIKIIANYSNLNIQYKCIEYLVNYIPTTGFNHIHSDLFQKNIINKLTLIYNNTEKFQNDQFYERFEPRYYISFLIRFLLNDNLYCILYKEYIQQNSSEIDSFILYTLHDMSELLYEIIYIFEKINTLSTDLTSVDQEDEILKVLKLIETFSIFFTENILLVNKLINDILTDIEISTQLYNKFQETLLHVIRKICINYDKYTTLIVTHNIELNIKGLLTKLIDIVIILNKSPYFNKLLFDKELEYSFNLFTKIKNILFSDSIYSWSIYYNLLELESSIEKCISDKKEFNIPDKFLDPILNTVMSNPVILPDSHIFINLDTIKTHLETNQTDPFNRTPLTIDNLETYNNQQEIIDKINEFKKELSEITFKNNF